MAIGSAMAQASTNATAGKDFLFSTDPAISAQQHAAYDVIHRYEQLLNTGDIAEILKLFAPEGVAEWNDKPTFATRQEKIDAYDALFKVAKFSTVFGYAGIDVHGDKNVSQRCDRDLGRQGGRRS